MLYNLRPLPVPYRWYHPVPMLATWFGAGRLPTGPGTWGALAALPFGAAIIVFAGPTGLWIAAGLVFAIGTLVSELYVRTTGRKDPSEIVIDEVSAQWMVMAVLPFDAGAWIAGFLLFRLFDIVKPWPVSLVDKHVGGGFGVMADDVVAAGYAIGCIFAFRLIISFGI